MPELVFFGGGTDEDEPGHPFWMGWVAIIEGNWGKGDFRTVWNQNIVDNVTASGAVSTKGAIKMWELIQEHPDKIKIWPAHISWSGHESDVLNPRKRKETYERATLHSRGTTLTPGGWLLPPHKMTANDFKANVDVTIFGDKGGLVNARRDLGDKLHPEAMWNRIFVGAGYDNPVSRNDPSFEIKEVQWMQMDKPTLDGWTDFGEMRVREHLKIQEPYIVEAWSRIRMFPMAQTPLINWAYTSGVGWEVYKPILENSLKEGVIPHQFLIPQGWKLEKAHLNPMSPEGFAEHHRWKNR